jgi:hypothetical protein
VINDEDLKVCMLTIFSKVNPRGHRFNKGRLFNAGVRYIEKQKSLNITCLILHDVDLIPENDGNFYSCESLHPKHTTIRVRQIGSRRGYSRFYEFLIGGVLLLTPEMYKRVNGFSNLYWGWGGEDDDLSLRMIDRRMCVARPVESVAIYAGKASVVSFWIDTVRFLACHIALPHPRGQRNNARFNLLTWSTVRLDTDGYAQIEPMTRIAAVRQRWTMTHLQLDVNLDERLYRSPQSDKHQFSSDSIHKHMRISSNST